MMGVARWMVVLVCCYLLQGSTGLRRDREQLSRILRLLRNLENVRKQSATIIPNTVSLPVTSVSETPTSASGSQPSSLPPSGTPPTGSGPPQSGTSPTGTPPSGSEPPPSGSEPPPSGSGPPPTGTLPSGTSPSGSRPPPSGSGPPPTGTSPSGSEPPPSGSGPPPTGTLPSGSGAPPTGTSPSGSGAPPSGSGAPPSGSGAPPSGSGAPPSGSGAPPSGSGAPPSGSGAPPSGSGAPPSGLGAPPSGSGAPPTGTRPSGPRRPPRGTRPSGPPPSATSPSGSPPSGSRPVPTGSGPNPTSYRRHSPTAVVPVDFYKPWIECPIMENLLFEYFKGFPNTSNANESIHILPTEIKGTLSKAVTTFTYLQNVRVTIDQLIEDLARLILQKRFSCKVTMYERIFVYFLRRKLGTMMAPEESSLRGKIQQIFNLHFQNSTTNKLTEDLVKDVHQWSHVDFIEHVQQEEFESLKWFLESTRWMVTHQLDQYHHGHINSTQELVSRMLTDFTNNINMYPDALVCTTPDRFIHMHRRTANMTTDLFYEGQRTGLISALATHHIGEKLREHGLVLNSTKIDEAVVKIVGVVLGYVTDAVQKISWYEQYLSTPVMAPPTFLMDTLDAAQYGKALALFHRIFKGIDLADILAHLKNEVTKLEMIKTASVNCTASVGIPSIVETMIAETQALLQRADPAPVPISVPVSVPRARRRNRTRHRRRGIAASITRRRLD